MNVFCFVPLGFDGELVSVEVDIRPGLPGTEIVGLAGAAVREARERVRVALVNSGFRYPDRKVLINLSPADVPKFGSGFDLAIAIALLARSKQISPPQDAPILAVGELGLDGSIRSARGVLSALAVGSRMGIGRFMVPVDDVSAARSLGHTRLVPLASLQLLRDTSVWSSTETPSASRNSSCESADGKFETSGDAVSIEPNYSDMRNRVMLKRACEIAAAGRHNLLLSGPPGCGKTMAAERLIGITPHLKRDQVVDVARIYSTAGLTQSSLVSSCVAPVRMPHHSSSVPGIVGGGRFLIPGELSLAHNGILILDEAPEFRRGVMQSLREPLEKGVVRLIRAERRYWYPADVQLVMTANACPCGNYGASGRRCMCGLNEIHNYRKRIGAALLDRVEIRVWQTEDYEEDSLGPSGDEDSSERMRSRVLSAARVQEQRYGSDGTSRNGRVSPAVLRRHVMVGADAAKVLGAAVPKLGLSSRAVDGVLRVARTIADLDGEDEISDQAMLEAIQLRREDR